MATNKSTHTPGPWRIGDARNTVFGPPNGKPSPQTIAHLGVIDHEANGRLIAAAPELLAALKAIAKVGGEDWAWLPHDVRAQVSAAILRAEGR